MNKRFRIMIATLCFALLFAASAVAHDMWVEVMDYTPAPGQEAVMALAYGHFFPTREYLPGEYLDTVHMVGPSGETIAVKKREDGFFVSDRTLDKPGAYLVSAVQKGRFWTKTTEGYQSGKSKKGLSNVISCTYSAKFGKAVINVPGGPGQVTKPLGHELEIVPLADPATLRKGDDLPVRVLFRGKPVAYELVLATWVGFSREKNTWGFATKTDADGMAKIRLLTDGAWLAATYMKEAYPETEVCDTYNVSATLTFEVK